MSDTIEQKRPHTTVGIYAVNKNGEILFIRSPKWQGMLVPPGGHIEYGETVENAILREMKEETNLKVKNPRIIATVDLIEPVGYGNKHMVGLEHVVDLDGENQEVKLELKEATEYLWLKPEDVVRRDDVEPTTKHVVQTCFVNRKEDAGADARWKRALSDYQNLQKEVAAQRSEWVRMSEAQILEEFLPVYSNFKKAFSQPVSANAAPGKLDGWTKGIEYIMKQFGDVLKAHDVEEIKTVGEKFDPTRHEAVGEEESDIGEGKIVREVEAGYTMKAKVIKPAKVVLVKIPNSPNS